MVELDIFVELRDGTDSLIDRLDDIHTYTSTRLGLQSKKARCPLISFGYDPNRDMRVLVHHGRLRIDQIFLCLGICIGGRFSDSVGRNSFLLLYLVFQPSFVLF